MKIMAYYVLHYGKEWLHWSLRSLAPHVDEVVILYTPTPSYGHTTTLTNPDTRDDLYGIAKSLISGSNLIWQDYQGGNIGEGAHRDAAVDICKERGADYVFVADYDEVWEHRTFVAALSQIRNAAKPAKNWRVPIQHYWRSVNWVCKDPSMPVRVLDLSRPINNNSDGYITHENGVVHHFGYAISPALMQYKWGIHGHKPEYRPGWFEHKFMKWKPNYPMDVHPTNIDFWNPASFDKNTIAHLVGDHPYFDLEIIK